MNTDWMKQHGMASARSVDWHISRARFIGDITGEFNPRTGRHVIGIQSGKMWLRNQTVFVTAVQVRKK